MKANTKKNFKLIFLKKIQKINKRLLKTNYDQII